MVFQSMDGESAPGLEVAPQPAAPSNRILRANQLGLIGFGFAALIVMTLVSVILAQRNRDAFELASRTQTLLSDTAQALELLEDAETGQRGFLLTEREAYLDPYKAAVSLIPDQLDRLVAETEDLAVLAEATKMRAKGLSKLTELAETIALYRRDGRAAALAVVGTGEGKVLMDAVRAAATAIRTDQQQKLTARIADTATTGRILIAAQVGTALLVVIISLLTGGSFYRNIRALRDAREALAGTNANLEKIVAARTAALRQANDEIQKFAYIVSHDLRAPLVNIMGFTSELEAAAKTVGRFVNDMVKVSGSVVPQSVVEAIDEDVPEAFRFIKTSTAKMDGLINAILKLSREGRRVLTPEPLPMRPLLENIAATLKHRADEMHAEIVIQPLPNLTADRLAIEQIFGNLMDNAVKYLAPSRPGVITVRGAIKGAFAVYEIEDNGRGIAPGDHERVFELFRRAGQQNVPGEGIGLAYVRQLIYRLGGTIALDSTFGQGTIFRLSLPLVGSKTQKDVA
jgi:signal transduction histidine kinase